MTPTWESGPTVLPHVAVRARARSAGDSPAVTVVDYRRGAGTGGGRAEVVVTLTYADLDARARAVAAALTDRCPPGARVAVLCPHDATYPVAVLGCLYAGMVAVPLHPPEFGRDRSRLDAVLADSDPACALVARPVADLPVAALDVGGLPAVDTGRWDPPEVSPDALAFLQYTSGSTGRPSGVRITHRNLATACAQIRRHYEPAVTASWVPFFHDFGLVCGLLTPLTAGAHTVHISPLAFIQDPYRWLDVASRYRADWTIAPNFSLDLCVRRVDPTRRSTVDLRALRLLTVAAEPVRAESVEAFATAFGLGPDVVTPSYGLAEATLPVSAPPYGVGTVARWFDRAALGTGRVEVVGSEHPDAVRLVSCGVPRDGVSVRVVDPEAGIALDGGTGEIWVHGPNVADGYWNRPGHPAFGNDLAGEGGGWLRTGDLGFLHDGNLYIAGRRKDVIIVRGRNHYPQDIETTVTAAPPGGWGTAAAFGVPTAATEQLVVVVEADRTLLDAEPAQRDRVIADLRREVTRAHGIEVHDLVPTRRGVLPKTTSGKIRRGECRTRYLRGDFGIQR